MEKKASGLPQASPPPRCSRGPRRPWAKARGTWSGIFWQRCKQRDQAPLGGAGIAAATRPPSPTDACSGVSSCLRTGRERQTERSIRAPQTSAQPGQILEGARLAAVRRSRGPGRWAKAATVWWVVERPRVGARRQSSSGPANGPTEQIRKVKKEGDADRKDAMIDQGMASREEHRWDRSYQDWLGGMCEEGRTRMEKKGGKGEPEASGGAGGRKNVLEGNGGERAGS